MSSRFIKHGENPHSSRLVKAVEDLTKQWYSQEPDGVYGAEATVICGGVTIKSGELDLEFTVPFGDNMEADEAEITIYNLTNDTINKFKKGVECSIEAGFRGDTGVIFRGIVSRVYTTYDGADKITRIVCVDDMAERIITSRTYDTSKNSRYILNDLLKETGLPIAVYSPRTFQKYETTQTVSGNLMDNIQKYAEDCGISVYINKGQIYARYIKDGDEISFTVSEKTGMISSPTAFEEEQQAEDFEGTVNGYNIQMLLQHRITTASIINLSSMIASGQYRVRSGRHIFNENEAVTEIEVI